MRKMKVNFYEKGQSLIELIIAFFVMALIVVAIVGLSTRSVRNSVSARDNSQARRYAEEGMEWVRKQRDKDWVSFYDHGSSGNSWCLKDLPETGWLGNASSCDVITNTIFTRLLKLEQTGDGGVNVEVKVSWDDSQGYHEVKLETKLYNLE